jgi:GTP-binding protein
MFIDKADILVTAGTGGDGSASFLREKFMPFGGPNGGDGGKGGDVYVVASDRIRTLLDYVRKRKFAAPNGNPGEGYTRFGLSGDDIVLEVPCGTSVYKDETLIGDLVENGEKILVAKGGRGGRGNVHFKNSVRQAPRIAEKGEPGEKVQLSLRLKILADVGLIGMPNAGKSTLLSRLTRAHPKIANYPFTTLHPNLGVAYYHERELILADMPGLIEGAHEGKGLGHDFLRHVERTRVLVHVVDPTGFDEKDAKANIKTINAELKGHSPDLAKKPQLIVVNKQDLTDADQVFKDIKKAYKKTTVLAASGVSGAGIPELLAEIVKLVDSMPVERPKPAPAAVHVKLAPDFWVEKGDDAYVVRGAKVERLIRMTNFKLEEAVMRTQNILKKIGVERELQHHGAKTGDWIRIAEREFEFHPEIGFQNPPPRRPPRRNK